MPKRVLDMVMGLPTHTIDDVQSPKSAQLYQMWHDKAPDGAHVVQFEFPRSVQPVGAAHRILYFSDKKEPDGQGYHYEHIFETDPQVYAPCNSPFGVCDTPMVPTSRVLRANIDGHVSLPMLALVRELTVRTLNGEMHNLVFSSHTPLLCMTEDKKGLVIFSYFDGVAAPLFIRGGKMHVTAHGIEK